MLKFVIDNYTPDSHDYKNISFIEISDIDRNDEKMLGCNENKTFMEDQFKERQIPKIEKSKIKRKKRKRLMKKTKNVVNANANENNRRVGKYFNTGRWTSEEHNKFLEALCVYGNNWRCVQNYIITRNSIQIRSHAQKYFMKIKNYLKCNFIF
jgi:SHAQKYF class myb-like DNA-binding protein